MASSWPVSCEDSGECCCVQHRREWPGADKELLKGVGGQETQSWPLPAAGLRLWGQDQADPHHHCTHSPQPAVGGLALFTPVVGKGPALPLEMDNRRPPGPAWI